LMLVQLTRTTVSKAVAGRPFHTWAESAGAAVRHLPRSYEAESWLDRLHHEMDTATHGAWDSLPDTVPAKPRRSPAKTQTKREAKPKKT